MWRWNPQNVFQVECAEFCSEKEGNHKDCKEPSFQAGCWSPIVLCPIIWTELIQDTLNLAFECWNVPQTSPVVWLHAEILTCLHAQVNAQAIANKEIEYPLK